MCDKVQFKPTHPSNQPFPLTQFRVAGEMQDIPAVTERQAGHTQSHAQKP